MKKICFTITVLVFSLSAVSFASPTTDYSQGKVAIDINFQPSLAISDGVGRVDGKSNNIELGATIGLGNKIAFQYKNSNIKTKDFPFNGTTAHTELAVNEYNIIYQIDKNISAFAGITNAKNDLRPTSSTHSGLGPMIPGSQIVSPFAGTTTSSYVLYTSTGNYTGKNITGFQVGVIGTASIGKDLNAYGIFAAGNKITSYEIGLGYEFAKNAELNLFYKDAKYKDLEFEGTNEKYDYIVKGIAYGITVKF